MPDKITTPQWDYTDHNGPEKWGNSFPICKLGQQQSPINIDTNTVTNNAKLAPLEINFTSSNACVNNTGHTIEVRLDQANTFSLGEKTYAVTQFHFHTPSEHTINNKHSALELHIVAQNDKSEVAVIGVLINQAASNPTLQTLFEQLPAQAGQSIQLNDTINLTQLLPHKLGYYSYPGSLTTPPCTEGVRWCVLQHAIDASADQCAQFSVLYPNNARPAQPLNGREVQRAVILKLL